MITFIWNLVFRKFLGPIDGVKTKIGVILVALSAVMHQVLAVIPSLVDSSAYHKLVIGALWIGSALAGLGIIDKHEKIADALGGKL